MVDLFPCRLSPVVDHRRHRGADGVAESRLCRVQPVEDGALLAEEFRVARGHPSQTVLVLLDGSQQVIALGDKGRGFRLFAAHDLEHVQVEPALLGLGRLGKREQFRVHPHDVVRHVFGKPAEVCLDPLQRTRVRGELLHGLEHTLAGKPAKRFEVVSLRVERYAHGLQVLVLAGNTLCRAVERLVIAIDVAHECRQGRVLLRLPVTPGHDRGGPLVHDERVRGQGSVIDLSEPRHVHPEHFIRRLPLRRFLVRDEVEVLGTDLAPGQVAPTRLNDRELHLFFFFHPVPPYLCFLASSCQQNMDQDAFQEQRTIADFLRFVKGSSRLYPRHPSIILKENNKGV